MLDIIWNLGSFVILLGILITGHEFGHFWVARKCSVKVERFSIGFGKAIWRRIGQDGTEYVIAMIPLGGYVKMLDERVDDVPQDMLDKAFNRKTVWKRIAIVSAGPIANFILAIIALYIMYLVGVPTIKPIIDSTKLNSPASIIQIDEPLQILSVSGQDVRNWEEVNLALVGHIGSSSIEITVAPVAMMSGMDMPSKSYVLNTENWVFDPEKESPISALGLGIFRPSVEPTIALVSKGSAAEKSGILVGDEIVQINGKQYSDWNAFVDVVQTSPNQAIQLTLLRQNEYITVNVVPTAQQSADGKVIGIVGISPTQAKWPDNMRFDLEYGIVDSVAAAADKTWQLVVVSFKMIGKLFTGDVSVKNLSGPISIAQGAGASANYGLVYFLGFMALISVNLGIINLMPLPVLDGGHLLYYFVEVITGKPVPEKVQEIGFRIGAALLLMLMSIALFNDFARL